MKEFNGSTPFDAIGHGRSDLPKVIELLKNNNDPYNIFSFDGGCITDIICDKLILCALAQAGITELNEYNHPEAAQELQEYKTQYDSINNDQVELNGNHLANFIDG